MKQSYLLLVVFLLLGNQLFSSNKNDERIQKTDSITIREQVQELEKSVLLLPSYEGQRQFFDLFPNTYNNFVELFGYKDIESENSEYGPLYLISEDYLEIFFSQLNAIDSSLYVNKIINITSDGKWQADAVNSFQSHLSLLFQKRSNMFINELIKKEDCIIQGFWRFYFNGPHPESYQKNYEKLYLKCKNINVNIADLMKEAYEKLLSQRDGHGH